MKQTLSIVIPLYNEEARLSKTLRALSGWTNPHPLCLKEVIFVDDGSTDATRTLVQVTQKSLAQKLKVKVHILEHDENLGKGAAVRKGMLKAKSEYALICDADMSTPLKEIKKLLPFMAKQLPVIVGTRKNGKSTVKVAQPLHRRVLGKAFTLVTQVMLNTWLSDFTCGFKLFDATSRKAIFSRSKINRWGYDAEILFLASRLGYDIQEKALLWYNDSRSHVWLPRDVISTFKDLLMIRWYWARGMYQLNYSRAMLKKISSWAITHSS